MYDNFNRELMNMLNISKGELAAEQMVKTLLFAAVLAAVLYITYKMAHSRNSYQPKFAVTLVILAFVSTILMDLIQSNLALSLGMLGSLSIVRFRTNIRDPRDIGFIVWSMAIGVTAATSSYVAGILGSVILMTLMIVTKKNDDEIDSKLLVIRGSSSDLDRIQLIVEAVDSSKIKAKNIMSDSFELVYEVSVSDKNSNRLIDEIFDVGGIDAVNLLTPSVA